MKHPPGVCRRRNLGAALERGDQHIERRHQREDREQREKKVRPSQRPGTVAAHAAVLDVARRRALVDRDRAHQASFPRLLTSRRMKIAAIASIGTMNSETLAPSGISLPSMPTRNAQVAKMWVWSSGPPAVKMRTISKFAKVTISENSVVIAMMLRIIGSVTYQMRCHQLAPSMAAAS